MNGLAVVAKIRYQDNFDPKIAILSLKSNAFFLQLTHRINHLSWSNPKDQKWSELRDNSGKKRSRVPACGWGSETVFLRKQYLGNKPLRV